VPLRSPNRGPADIAGPPTSIRRKQRRFPLNAAARGRRDGIARLRKTAIIRPTRRRALAIERPILDLERLRAAPLHRDPFEFIIVEDFLDRAWMAALVADFPRVDGHGSYPLEVLSPGPSMAGLAAELTAPALREAVEEKFGVVLEARPTMITVRGRSDGKDGRAHTDSETKIVTLLLYLNPQWPAETGRLRLLRGPENLADYVAEVPPLAGTMVAFRRSGRSWHGHRAHVGERRVVQLNWVTDAGVVRRETGRHRWSARLKALSPFA